jgi:hypothetical protein
LADPAAWQVDQVGSVVIAVVQRRVAARAHGGYPAVVVIAVGGRGERGRRDVGLAERRAVGVAE